MRWSNFAAGLEDYELLHLATEAEQQRQRWWQSETAASVCAERVGIGVIGDQSFSTGAAGLRPAIQR
jgi:hypothetical protein